MTQALEEEASVVALATASDGGRGFLPLLQSFAKASELLRQAMYYVYILYSPKSKDFYYGFTKDLRKRLVEHNGEKSKATKPFIPWRLVYYSAFEEERLAKDFEKYLKTGSGKAFAYKRLVQITKYKK